MTYKFLTTERNNATKAEYETKALLYLMSEREDSEKIDNYVIDCFNDISGCSNSYDEIWDVQAKGVKSLNPKKIGIALYTLYSNFLHHFPFKHFILVIPELGNIYFENDVAKIYNINHFKQKYIPKIYEGLTSEYKRRKGIDISSSDIDSFINTVAFVEASATKVEYIRNLMKFRSPELNDVYFTDIFNEISNRQTICKNINVHNTIIKKVSDVVELKKVIRKNEIYALIVNRFLGPNIFKSQSRIPISFFNEIAQFDEEERNDIIQNVNSEFARLLFDKNNKLNFWAFFEKVVFTVMKFKNLSIKEIFNKLDIKEINKCVDIQYLTLIYLITLIKDGLENED